MKVAHRFSGPTQPYVGLTRMTEHGPVWTGTVRTIESALDEPLHWKKPARIFVNSMSDLFHEGVPFDFISRVFHTMRDSGRHTFQILTKRPARMREYLDSERGYSQVAGHEKEFYPLTPLPNVWLGVSVENQAAVDERLPILVQTPAAVRFLSVEPLLEKVDLGTWFFFAMTDAGKCAVDWVIVGGESGPRARPCNIEWVRDVVRQCKAAGVACFVKQLGAKPIGYGETERLKGFDAKYLDRKGGNLSEWPDDLRVREFPK